MEKKQLFLNLLEFIVVTVIVGFISWIGSLVAIKVYYADDLGAAIWVTVFVLPGTVVSTIVIWYLIKKRFAYEYKYILLLVINILLIATLSIPQIAKLVSNFIDALNG